MDEIMYKVYAKVNENGCITSIESTAFYDEQKLIDDGFIKIDEGTDGRIYGHAQPNYLIEKYGQTMYDESGKCNFKYTDGKVVELTEDEKINLDELKLQKRQEISTTCNQLITNGIDVDLSIGKKHFSLTTEDQLNLFGKQVQLASGAEQFEYHADGEKCIYFLKEDMTKIIEAAMSFVSYHTTYCNSMYTWIASVGTKEDLDAITYGTEIPEEYQSDVLKTYISMMA